MSRPYRKGDVVSVIGTIRHDYRPGEDNSVFIDVDGHYGALLVSPEQVMLLAPRIDVGEHVRWTNGNEGRVLASDSDKLWVKLDDGSYVIWPVKEVTVLAQKAADLDPVEPPPVPLDGKVSSEEEA